MSEQQDKEGVDTFEKWSQSALVPKGFTIYDRLKHTWEAGFAAGRAAEREEKEKLEQQVATLTAEVGRLRDVITSDRKYHNLPEVEQARQLKAADERIVALTAANERLTKIVEQGTPSRQDYFTAVKNRDGMMEKVVTLTDALEKAREALISYSDGDECACCDGSPDQPKQRRCSYCLAQYALAALGKPQGKVLSGEGKGDGWLPIMSAPKNQRILVWPYFSDGLAAEVQWVPTKRPAGGRWQTTGGLHIKDAAPTHWMLLPDPPQESK